MTVGPNRAGAITGESSEPALFSQISHVMGEHLADVAPPDRRQRSRDLAALLVEPGRDSAATCSPRTRTPSSSATGGIRKAVADALVAPTRPAAITVST
jgi:hypothetical protein